MLVVTRRVGERLKIGPNIWVMVTRIEEGSVRIAIDAPRNMTIVREELLYRAAKQSGVQCHPKE